MKNYLTKALTNYYRTRYLLEAAERDYLCKKEKCRKYLCWENQLKEFKKTNDSYEWPLTRMHIRNIRKIRETECREAKRNVKELQKKFSWLEGVIYVEASMHFNPPAILDVPKDWVKPMYDYSINQNPTVGENNG